MVVRVFDGSHRRWSSTEAPGGDRRDHSRVPGDRGVAFLYGPGRNRCSVVPLCSPWHATAPTRQQRARVRGEVCSPLAAAGRITRPPRIRPTVSSRLRLRLSLQRTADLLNPDFLTQTGTKTWEWSGDSTEMRSKLLIWYRSVKRVI